MKQNNKSVKRDNISKAIEQELQYMLDSDQIKNRSEREYREREIHYINKQTKRCQKIINNFRLNQVFIAQKMEMPVGTFKNKLNASQTKYSFSAVEIIQLYGVLLEIANDMYKSLTGDLPENKNLRNHKNAFRKHLRAINDNPEINTIKLRGNPYNGKVTATDL